ncbi:Hypothetical protein, putative [Bodo saltans]|uniref:Uncharacterized protein n=1 Tax=Bodo saltans TaxID=75058 RepID=A0A0S4JR02_BODSA|nr:Hypothetical protein, putative [Bodo saltans]|eukprot:CUG92409.1 Hypothetical protein, putative [Bodo saltans]
MFQRIMRKLQHQANYSESTVSLTQQVLGVPQLVPLRDAQTPPAPQQQDAAPPPHKLQPGMRAGGGGGAGGKNGMLSGMDPSTTTDPTVDSLDQQGSSSPKSAMLTISSTKDLDEEEERKFGLQPCPPTLRTVVEFVRETIEEKLELAHIGSLWEAMKCIFESRTMLDKLLKEVAQHTHFQEVGGSDGGGGGGMSSAAGTAATRIHEMYQELRKVPVILPQATYAQDATGRYVPALKGQGEAGSGGGGAKLLAHHPQPPPRGGPNHSAVGRATSPTETAIRGSGHHHHFQHSTSPTHHLHSAAAVLASSSIVAQKPEMFVHTVMAAKDKRDHELLMKHLRRKTQWMEAGVQTDENNLNIILKEQYITLGKHCGDLEMELENKKGDIKTLTKKYHDAKQLLSQKTKVVEYLRGTLFKETVLLRQQLAAAHQRHLMMQQQQQILSQQMMSQVSAIGSGGGGGGAMSFNSTTGSITSNNASPSGQQFSQTHSSVVMPVIEEFDITAISSVIDLALLGVEKNRAMNRTTAEMVKIAAASGGLLSEIPASATNNDPLLTANTEVQVTRLREELQIRTMKWKRELAAMRSKFAIVVNEKNKQIKSIQTATDMKNLRSILLTQIGSLREEYATLRRTIRETLSSMRNGMLSNLAEVEYSIKLISDAMDISTEKSKTVLCQSELLKACHDLFVPMLSLDYAVGSHRWLQRHRPGDPLLHALQIRTTPDVISTVAPELEGMHQVYLALQKFVVKHYQVPQIANPQTGTILVTLIQTLLGDINCTPDLTHLLRTSLQIEFELCRKLARLNFKIKVTTAKQKTAQDVAVRALREMGIDSNAAASGPTQKVINRLVLNVTMLQTMRADALRQRLSNAKEVHRLWRESAMDPFRGRRPPKIRDIILQTAAPMSGGGALGPSPTSSSGGAQQFPSSKAQSAPEQHPRKAAAARKGGAQRGDAQAPAPSFSE